MAAPAPRPEGRPRQLVQSRGSQTQLLARLFFFLARFLLLEPRLSKGPCILLFWLLCILCRSKPALFSLCFSFRRLQQGWLPVGCRPLRASRVEIRPQDSEGAAKTILAPRLFRFARRDVESASLTARKLYWQGWKKEECVTASRGPGDSYRILLRTQTQVDGAWSALRRVVREAAH